MKNKVIEAIYRRRSIRNFQDKQVPKDIIDEILNAAVMAPSARNTQPWHFTIVEGKDRIYELGKKVTELQKKHAEEFRLISSIIPAKFIFHGAPLLIIISGKKDYKWLKDDVNLAVQNMFLAAYSLGIGSCWIGFAKVFEKDHNIKNELGIPDDMEIVAPLIFGYPSKTDAKIPKRKPKILKWIK
ncbi:nitroreductase [Candidatus Woesearchaeota archaeon]|nr:nitroreductase [Candidatus Woesearchaeota archaeon]